MDSQHTQPPTVPPTEPNSTLNTPTSDVMGSSTPPSTSAATPQEPVTVKRPLKLGRIAMIAGILVFGVVAMASAFVLSKRTTENRSQAAATAGSCAGLVAVNPSQCNEKCGADADCMNGMICYKTGGATEGVCRNPANPTSTTCGTTASALPTPSPFSSKPPSPAPSGSPTTCTKSCTFNYDCNIANNEACIGTNVKNTTPGITASAPRAATPAELSVLAADQIIFMSSGTNYKPDANGNMPFTVVSKQATSFYVRVYDITAPKDKLDPQKLVYEKTFSIGANQLVAGTVTLPRCGRYQVDFGSAIVTGTKYDHNPAAHYFWGTVFEIPCQAGCCQVISATNPAVAAPQDIVREFLAVPSTGKAIDGYTALSGATTVFRNALPTYTFGVSTFPDNFPAGVASVKFEVNGQQARIDNEAPFLMSDTALNLPVGTYSVKATLYSLNNAQGNLIKSKTTTIEVK